MNKSFIHHIAGWKKMEDSVYGVDTYVVTQKEKEDRLVPFFGDNALSMWITTDKCSFKKHVEHLSKFKKGDASCVSNFTHCSHKSQKGAQVGNDQEMAQSERNSHSNNRGVGKSKLTLRYLYQENIS